MADMEGASGIFENNKKALYHEEMAPNETLWRTYGRACITSDVLAVCNAAIDWGIDDILLYDMHFAGCAEYNIELDILPKLVRTFDVPNREFHSDMLRAQADNKPFGIITVGQHARNGEPYAYFPHTIHTPPLKSFFVNGIHMAEIGNSLLTFPDIPYIANIGCAASHKEAKELSNDVTCISVKDKSKNWEPLPEETYSIIYNGVIDALDNYSHKTAFKSSDTYSCELHLTDDYYFDTSDVVWDGILEKRKALFETDNSLDVLNRFWKAHDYIVHE